MTYVVRLENCVFYGWHGVLKEEEKLGQRFAVDVEMTVEGEERDLASDRLDRTVDYSKVFRLVETIVTGERFRLIEALALSIARRVSDAFPAVRGISVTVRKPSVPMKAILDHVSATVALP